MDFFISIQHSLLPKEEKLQLKMVENIEMIG